MTSPASNPKSAARCLVHGHDSEEALRVVQSGLPASADLEQMRRGALALADDGRYQEAMPLLDEILRRAPGDPSAMRRMGEIYTALHDMKTAELWFERGLAANPADRDLLVANLLHWWRLGDLERARSLYRSRLWRVTTDNWLHPDVNLWQGQNCSGKTLRLAVGDFYFGDALQFVRLARLAKAAGATVIVECPRQLSSLMRTVPGVDRVIPFGSPFPPYDYQAPAFWLLFALPLPIDELAGDTPYLDAPEELRSEWRSRICSRTGINVGIVWAGSRYRRREPHGCRSMPLDELRPLAAISGVNLYSLQCGPGRDELIAAHPAFPAIDLAPDFPNTAAAILALDLVVTIDTSIAHLAGALGRPVYVLLPYDACFRWMLDRDDTPWYASMRLFRQKEPGQWSHPVAAVAAAISNLLAERSTR
jgi:Tetratricopeptide repeat